MMDDIKQDALIIAAGVVIVVLIGRYVKNNAADLGAGAVNAVVDLAAGAAGAASDAAGEGVQEMGTWFGLPRTSQTECEKALAKGGAFDGFFVCPAGTFIGSIFGHSDPSQELQVY